MQKLYFYLPLFLFVGCTSNPQISGSEIEPSINTCPESPISPLEAKNVKSISLSTTEITKESGQLQAGKSLGYSFKAESGQKLIYQTKDNVCIWIFTLSNTMLKSVDLPSFGQYAMTDLPSSEKYIIQISALKGSTTFNLEMSLGDLAASMTPVAPSPTTSASPINSSLTSPNPIPISSPSVVVSRPSPEQAVRDYFSKINNRQYPEAWNQLTSKFQREKAENSYPKFIEWWDRVRQVDIQQTSLISNSNETAIVDVNLSYRMQDGKILPDFYRIYFVWNESTSLWTFNETERQNN